MWQYHWRTLSIEVDGTAYSAKADTTVAAFMRDHRDFERKPGRLLSVEGKVLEPSGGNTVSVKFRRQTDRARRLGTTHVSKKTARLRSRRAPTLHRGDITEEAAERCRSRTDIQSETADRRADRSPSRARTGCKEFRVGRQSKKGLPPSPRFASRSRSIVKSSFANRARRAKKVISRSTHSNATDRAIYSDKILDILKQNKVKATVLRARRAVARIPEGGAGHRRGRATRSPRHQRPRPPYFPNMSAQEQRQEIESKPRATS